MAIIKKKKDKVEPKKKTNVNLKSKTHLSFDELVKLIKKDN